MASDGSQTQRMSLTWCCSGVSRRCRLLSTVTRLFLLKFSFVRWNYALVTILPRALGTEVFFAVGPISTLGLVGDSGRTVRSLSAASKPRIYPTHDAVTPSIQEEGAEHIFRVREFQFLLGKICVAHSVAHSSTLLLCCALSVEVEFPPAGPRRYR